MRRQLAQGRAAVFAGYCRFPSPAIAGFADPIGRIGAAAADAQDLPLEPDRLVAPLLETGSFEATGVRGFRQLAQLRWDIESGNVAERVSELQACRDQHETSGKARQPAERGQTPPEAMRRP